MRVRLGFDMKRVFVVSVIGWLAIASVLLGGCRARSDAGFAQPLSNSTEPHREHGGLEAHEHTHPPTEAVGADMQVVLVASELVLGFNRFAVGLFDADGDVVLDADVHLHYFDLSDPGTPRLELEADAAALRTPDGRTAIFAHERDFARAGPWGVEVQARLPDGTVAVERIAFEVRSDTSSLRIGERVPEVHTPTSADTGGDLTRLTSAPEPRADLYEIDLIESVASGRPTVLLFATPAFCRTRFCGPAYQTAAELQASYGADANFLHVEVFAGLPDPAGNDWRLAPAMTAFGLDTEPWLYLIDGEGVVAHRVEGLFTFGEIERHLLALLGR